MIGYGIKEMMKTFIMKKYKLIKVKNILINQKFTIPQMVERDKPKYRGRNKVKHIRNHMKFFYRKTKYTLKISKNIIENQMQNQMKVHPT